MKTLLPLLLIILLFGCKQPAKQKIVKDKPQSFWDGISNLPNGNKIIFIDNVYLAYIKAKQNGIKDSGNIYMQILYKSRAMGSLTYRYIGGHKVYYTDTVFPEEYLLAIKGSQEEVKELITSALSDANKILKSDSITLYVTEFTKDDKVQKFGGVDVILLSGGMKKYLSIDTTIVAWRETLKYCIAREFYIDYWMKHYDQNITETILCSLILQGRADFYANLIYPDIDCPWNNALKKNEEKQIWHRIKPRLHDSTLFWSPILLNPGTLYYSFSCESTLAYHIVQSALKHHPKLTPEQWTNLTPEKILEMSGYK